jgi:hypothetical protein
MIRMMDENFLPHWQEKENDSIQNILVANSGSQFGLNLPLPRLSVNVILNDISPQRWNLLPRN